MNTPAILTLLRYLLTFGGGFLVAKGYLAEADLETVIGAIVSLFTVASGIYVNSKNTAKVEAAKVVLEQTEPPVSQNAIAQAAATVQK